MFVGSLAKLAAYLFILACVVWSFAYFFLPVEYVRLSALEGRFLLFGGVSSLAISLALGMWAARRLSARFDRREVEDFGLARRWTRFFGAHHTLFGWLAFAGATAHSLYFFSASPFGSIHAVTGWVAWGVLLALVAAGARLSRIKARNPDQKGIRRKFRVLHGVLAAVFGVALSLHAAIIPTALGAWLILAIPTVLVWRYRKTRRNMKVGKEAEPEATGEDHR